MRWTPRLLAGTAVVIAAALTAGPVTAGLADLVLNPGPPTAKRSAQPALTSQLTPSSPSTARSEGSTRATTTDRRSGADEPDVVEGTVVDDGTTLVAATADAAQARVSDLAADLQAGVAAGEFTQADADRVLADISGYIHGDRTWPERFSA